MKFGPRSPRRRPLRYLIGYLLHLDGRVSHPIIQIDDVSLEWDFSEDISGRKLAEVSGNQRHGLIYQLPARAVTGPQWDGTYHDWKSCPQHYDAVHFHSDDLYDVDWSVSASLELPRDLASGIYAFCLTTDSEIERTPFFVTPAGTKQASNVALLMPSCTYMAYANHRVLIEGANFVAARSRLRLEHEYIRDHPEIGPSMYEKHRDGSGVMYSSRHRPILQLHPGADGWDFTPDTDINAFMTTLDLNHDVITDEDFHADGFAALLTHKVLVTGSHAEYWSTAMLDALEQWLRNGGPLLYLGGNGFYWRVAFSDAWPGAIELRRAEDGVRNWQTETGESYHSFNGEYGGMWRRLGRAPNELVGVGFAAQGFERAIGYRRSSASYDPRTAWIFDGVDEQHIGLSGLGGGAAGQEVDSYNPDLGSTTHAVILASATEFGPDMSRTKEELQASILVPSPDPVVRADMVFFETRLAAPFFQWDQLLGLAPWRAMATTTISLRSPTMCCGDFWTPKNFLVPELRHKAPKKNRAKEPGKFGGGVLRFMLAAWRCGAGNESEDWCYEPGGNLNAEEHDCNDGEDASADGCGINFDGRHRTFS